MSPSAVDVTSHVAIDYVDLGSQVSLSRGKAPPKSAIVARNQVLVVTRRSHTPYGVLTV